MPSRTGTHYTKLALSSDNEENGVCKTSLVHFE